MNCIQTARGGVYHPLAPRPADVNIEDIAHALSMLCRYGGHCLEFYSVAQHSVLVANHCSQVNKLWGLLHDASEAYLIDVPRPIKPALVGYRELEALNMRVICDVFGLPHQMPDEVHQIDMAMLATEREQLMAVETAFPWELPELALPLSIVPWAPAEARRIFLETFLRLHGETG